MGKPRYLGPVMVQVVAEAISPPQNQCSLTFAFPWGNIAMQVTHGAGLWKVLPACADCEPEPSKKIDQDLHV